MEASKVKEGTVSINYPMLSKSNYTVWSMKMQVFMEAQGVGEAVEPSDPEVNVEKRMDKMALAAIYQGIPEEFMLTLVGKKTAKVAWEAIKTMCMGVERVQEARVQTLKGEFESLMMKDSEKIEDFCLKLSGIMTNIRVLGKSMEESSVVRKILRVVPDKFLQIASNIERFGDVKAMSVEELVGRLKAHEERMKGRSEQPEQQQLLLAKKWKGRLDKSKIKCFNCNIYDHFASECDKLRRKKKHCQEAILAQLHDDEPALL
ncbi:uncharacterized protein LOC108212576 [Daucus carota subsp. sativus]|uniref:uncharacterized protein LOC108212576 n=1 Tax=Daucus carota subsp. sativus TaxID=79200 RepID=UPI003082C479